MLFKEIEQLNQDLSDNAQRRDELEREYIGLLLARTRKVCEATERGVTIPPMPPVRG